jgi:autotransporter-associated beta strand protein
MSGGINTNGQVLTVGSNTGNGHALISGVISSSGGLTKVGVNRLTLSGANSYTGSTYITSGGLIMGANDVLPNSSVVYFNGGMLDNGGYTDQLGQLNIPNSSTLSLRGNGVITFGSVGGLLDYKRLTILGWQGNYGETSAAGPSSATGTRVKFASMLAPYQLDQLWFNDGSSNYYALQLSDGTFEIVPGQDVVLYPKAFSNIIINTLSTSGGSWNASAPWVFTVSADNANINYTDIQTRLGSGSVTITTVYANGTQSGSVILNASGNTLSANNNGSAARNLVISANSHITISSPITLSSTTNGYSVTTGYPSIGVQLLSSTGDVIVSSAINTTAGNNSVGSTSAGVAGAGGAVTISAAGKVSIVGAITTTGGYHSWGGYPANVGGRGGDVSITGVGGVSVSGSISTYAGDNSYYGSRQGQVPGNLMISTDNATLTSGGVNDGQTSGNFYVGSITKNGSGIFQIKNSSYGGYDDANQVMYRSATTINGGTLKLGTNSEANLRNYGDVVVNSGAVLDLGSCTNESVGSISGSGRITSSGSGSLVLTMSYNNPTSTTFSGLIENGSATSIGLYKNGSGTLTLSGANTYTGLVTVNQGIINVRNNTALGTIAGGVSVTNGATLQLQGGVSIGTEALTLRGDGVNSYGALESVSGVNSWSGDVTLAAASRIGSDADSLSVSGNINLATFGLTVGNFVGNGNMLLSGILSSTSTGGTLTKSGGSRVTLTGGNTYTGTTSVVGGLLIVKHNTALGGTGAVTVNNTGSLALSNNISIGSGKSLTLLGAGFSGTVVGALANIDGNNTWVGTITTQTNNAYIRSVSGTLTLSGNIALNITTYFGGSSNIISTGIISGGQPLFKDGTGTFTIGGAGNNTYTGATNLTDGTLKYGSATGGSSGSAFFFSGGTLDDGGYNLSLGTLNLTANSTLNIGATQHAITFSSHTATFTAATILTINGWNGTSATTAITKNGQLASSSTVYVDYRGAQQSVIVGGLNQYGQILNGLQGAGNLSTQLIINNAATNGGTASALTATQLNQLRFINGTTLARYYGVYKGATEIIPSAVSH